MNGIEKRGGLYDFKEIRVLAKNYVGTVSFSALLRSWGAFEIKLGEHQVESAASSLLNLRNKMITNGVSPPNCLCVITGGGYGRQRDDGVYVIPIISLKP